MLNCQEISFCLECETTMKLPMAARNPFLCLLLIFQLDCISTLFCRYFPKGNFCVLLGVLLGNVTFEYLYVTFG